MTHGLTTFLGTTVMILIIAEVVLRQKPTVVDALREDMINKHYWKSLYRLLVKASLLLVYPVLLSGVITTIGDFYIGIPILVLLVVVIGLRGIVIYTQSHIALGQSTKIENFENILRIMDIIMLFVILFISFSMGSYIDS